MTALSIRNFRIPYSDLNWSYNRWGFFPCEKTKLVVARLHKNTILQQQNVVGQRTFAHWALSKAAKTPSSTRSIGALDHCGFFDCTLAHPVQTPSLYWSICSSVYIFLLTLRVRGTKLLHIFGILAMCFHSNRRNMNASLTSAFGRLRKISGTNLSTGVRKSTRLSCEPLWQRLQAFWAIVRGT